ELDAALDQSAIVAPEVVGAEEECDAATGLVADGGLLLGRRGAREQQRRAVGAARPHAHPAFALFRDGRVFDQVEAEHSSEEGDRLVVVTADERAVLQRVAHQALSAAGPSCSGPADGAPPSSHRTACSLVAKRRNREPRSASSEPATL